MRHSMPHPAAVERDRKRRRYVDYLQFKWERQGLASEIEGLNLAILEARKVRDPWQRQGRLIHLRERLGHVQRDFIDAQCRERSALRDSGRWGE